MEIKETVAKLKELIFIKKGTGQKCDEEEQLLKDLEQKERDAEIAHKEALKALEENRKAQSESSEKCSALRKRLAGITVKWREAAMELFREERNGEELYDKEASLMSMVGIESSRRGVYRLSIMWRLHRERWVADDLDVLGEDFRMQLIRDNAAHYEKTHPTKRRGRPPIPEYRQFIPSQAAALIGRGIPLPDWMQEAYDKWTRRNLSRGRDIHYGIYGMDEDKD